VSGRLDGFTRSILWALAVALALAGAGYLVSSRLMALPPSPEAPPTVRPEPKRSPGAVARVVEGAAQRSTGTGWAPLAQGESIAGAQSVRTGDGARVELEFGGAESRVTLPEKSEVGIGEVSGAVHQLKLLRGRVQVAYQRSGERVLRIEGEDGSVAETRGASFVMAQSGVAVAVATESGSVDLSAQGGKVAIGAGQQAVAVRGERPSEAAPIPKEALLKVARAAAKVDLCALVQGTVRPGSSVQVDGAPVEVGPDGKFEAKVGRRPGLLEVAVEVHELFGATMKQQVACAPRLPQVKPEVKVDWNAEP
jgi:hypothetical protein